MAGTARPRLNHYERLGVPPTAAAEEIARAFSREGNVFRAHAFGGLAEVCIAYETLRDPVKRRAYDASLGLRREPEPPFSRPPNQVSPQPVQMFRLSPAIDSQVVAEPSLDPGPLQYPGPKGELGAEAHPIDWRWTATALGGAVLAACAVGVLAGWWSTSAIVETPSPENSVSVPLPPARPVATPAAPPVAAPRAEDGPVARSRPRKPAGVTANPVTDAQGSPEAAATERVAQEPPVATGLTPETAAEEEPAAAVPLPLPNRVIARTIERIGYSCGSVASTAPVEGEGPGVFKVTCSSGQSYQAKPVRGRYHFRRWDRR